MSFFFGILVGGIVVVVMIGALIMFAMWHNR